MSSKGKYVILGVSLLLIIYSTIITISFKKSERLLNDEEDKYIIVKNELSKTEKYVNCILEEYNEEDNTIEINNKIEEVNNYFKGNYRVSVYYEDINTGFHYEYREDALYYGASLIKLLEAMYIYEGAINGNINIDDKMIYTSIYKNDYSIGMDKHKYGDYVSLRELVDYAVRYSDNTAHAMLYNYIGHNNIVMYGSSIGAKYTLRGDDSYGIETARDTNCYLRHAYKLINSNAEYGDMLKETMMNTYYNSLCLTIDEENNVAHKYGMCGVNYHDIGIVYDDGINYNISVLTTYGEEDYESIVRDIHMKIKSLHDTFYNSRKEKCQILVDNSFVE